MAIPATPITPHAVNRQTVDGAQSVYTTAISLLSPLDRLQDGLGEYEVASRSSRHTYLGLDGRPLHAKAEQRKDQEQYGPAPDWKPFPLRWPFLAVLVAALLGIVAVTEYACRTLPVEGPALSATSPSSPSLLAATAVLSLTRREIIARRPEETDAATGRVGIRQAPPVRRQNTTALGSVGGGTGDSVTRTERTTTSSPETHPSTATPSQTTQELLTGTTTSPPPKATNPPPSGTAGIHPSQETTRNPPPQVTSSQGQRPPPVETTSRIWPPSPPPPPEQTSTSSRVWPPSPPPPPPPPDQTSTSSRVWPPPPAEQTSTRTWGWPTPLPSQEITTSRVPPPQETTTSRVWPPPSPPPPPPPPPQETTTDPRKETTTQRQPFEQHPIASTDAIITEPSHTAQTTRGGVKANLPSSTQKPEPTGRPVSNENDTQYGTFRAAGTQPSVSQVDDPSEFTQTTDKDKLFGPMMSVSDTTGLETDQAGPYVTVDYVTSQVITTTDAQGSPTVVTVATTPVTAPVELVLTDSRGLPTRTITTMVTLKPKTITMTNSAGIPTTTVTHYVAYPTRKPSANGTSFGGAGAALPVFQFSTGDYFVGFFLPTLVGVFLMILVRMVETSARQLQPFHRLAWPGKGAAASDSICLRAGLLESIPSAVRTAADFGTGGWSEHPPVALLSKLLLLAAAIMIPLFPEAIALKVNGNRKRDVCSGCAVVSLGVFPGPARGAIGVLAFMALLSLIILVSLHRWRTGVAANPWSIVGMAGLAQNAEIRALLRSLPLGEEAAAAALVKRKVDGQTKGRSRMGVIVVGEHTVTQTQMFKASGDRLFRLSHSPLTAGDSREGGGGWGGNIGGGGSPGEDYGVVISNEGSSRLRMGDAASRLSAGRTHPGDDNRGLDHYDDGDYDDDDGDTVDGNNRGRSQDGDGGAPRRLVPKRGSSFVVRLARRNRHHLPFMMMSWVPRLLFVALGVGLLTVILYYNFTSANTEFERFMNHEGSGVRVFFTIIGVGMAFFWSSFFTNVAILSPYLQLSSNPQDARHSVLASPPNNAFEGLYQSLRRGHYFLASVALAAVLAEFMPVLLSTVPHRLSKTYVTHQVCTWLAVAFLAVMLGAMAASFLIRWPHMPVDPSSPAGAMFYVCESGTLLWACEGTSVMAERGRNKAVEGLGLRYEFGVIEGVSGLPIIGVDAREVLEADPDAAVVAAVPLGSSPPLTPPPAPPRAAASRDGDGAGERMV